MFGSGSFARVRQMFDDQFEPDSGAFLYRKSMRAAPIRVTAGERDAFVAAFAGAQRRATWQLIAFLVIAVALLIMLPASADQDPSGWAIYAITGVALCGYLFRFRMIWNAPARALEGRPLLGPERTRAEVVRKARANMTWGRMLAIIGGAAIGWLRLEPGPHAWSGWQVLWAAAGVLLFAGFGFRAWQKWRLARNA